MRFVIETNDEDGFVDLSLELQHISNYIQLNQLRFNNNLQIDFEYVGITEHKKIIPFLLITLVENAFKYGDLSDSCHPLKIRIDISSTGIRFEIFNKINTLNLYEKHGIGMENLKKRLIHFYKTNFKLDIKNDGHFYNCVLQIEY